MTTNDNPHPIVDEIFALGTSPEGKLDFTSAKLGSLKPKLTKMDDVELASALTSVVAFAGFLSRDCDDEEAATLLLEWALDSGKPLLGARPQSRRAAHEISRFLGNAPVIATINKGRSSKAMGLRELKPTRIEHHAAKVRQDPRTKKTPRHPHHPATKA